MNDRNYGKPDADSFRQEPVISSGPGASGFESTTYLNLDDVNHGQTAAVSTPDRGVEASMHGRIEPRLGAAPIIPDPILSGAASRLDDDMTNDKTIWSSGAKGAAIVAALLLAGAVGYALAVFREPPRIAALPQAPQVSATTSTASVTQVVAVPSTVKPVQNVAPVKAATSPDETSVLVPASREPVKLRPIASKPVQKKSAPIRTETAQTQEECCSDADAPRGDDRDVVLAPGPQPLGATRPSEPYFNEDMIDAPRPVGQGELRGPDPDMRGPDSSDGRW